MIKTIYINPGDMIRIRVIQDPDLPKTSTEWEYQIRPEEILLVHKGPQHLAYSDPALRIDLTTPFGKIIRSNKNE
jgi:hypothetical protein